MEFLQRIQAEDDWKTEALRALGGLLFGIGVFVLLIRRTSFENPWGEFAVFVTLLIPALVLYGGGIMAARAAAPRPWHSVWVVFGILFVYGALLQFITLIDGDTGAPLNTVWTLCVVAAVAAGAAIFARVDFGWLVAGVALAIAWLALWDEILENGVGEDAGTLRGLCMIATLGLVAAAWMVERRGRERSEAAELVTAGGLIFLLGAGVVSLASLAGLAAFNGGGLVPGEVPTATGLVEPSLFWDLVLLGGSIALIAVANLAGNRGPAYVGATGILLFIVIVGIDLDAEPPTGKIIGWPLVLIAVALLAIAASALAGRRSVGARDQAP